MARSQKKTFPIRLRYVVLFLILLALLLAAVGTVAWMRYIRSLQTVTLVQVSNLLLEGPTPTSVALDLGDFDVSEEGSKKYVFGVHTFDTPTFYVQLGHTTNTPFRYTIYQAEKSDTKPDSEYVYEGGFYFLNKGVLPGKYVNQLGTQFLADKNHDFYGSTYDKSKDTVQKNAVPLYWKSGSVSVDSADGNDGSATTYFILEISWGAGESNNKETDMVYLTVGTAGGGTES